VDHRDERIVLETGRYRISGLLSLPRDGYRSRLTDFLNAAERDFIALTDVDLMPLDGVGAPEHRDFIAIARSQIVLAAPIEAEAEGLDTEAG
jgi:hypothetical protein